jgi:hypothetical protein
MRKFSILIIGFCIFIFEVNAQCIHIALADSSFEEDTFENGDLPVEKGFWYRDDGCYIYGDVAYDGDSSACSTWGGGFQLVQIESNTTYYLSCYVQNGVDASVSFIIDGVAYFQNVISDD